MFKIIVFILSVFLSFSCAGSSHKTTAKKIQSTQKIKTDKHQSNTSNQISSDLCKNENCPGYVK